MTFEIRKATPEDADEIGFIQCMTWLETYEGLIDEDFMASLSPERSITKFRELSCDELLVLTANGKDVGFSSCCKARDDDLPEAGDIRSIYIIKGYQKLGYGQKLLEASIEKLRQDGYNDIVIWILKKNAAAIDFYEKFGFVEDGKTKTLDFNAPVTLKRYILRK
jgi:GNAT superfamily N-acetyltransferase